jgi:hypothetical protein
MSQSSFASEGLVRKGCYGRVAASIQRPHVLDTEVERKT